MAAALAHGLDLDRCVLDVDGAVGFEVVLPALVRQAVHGEPHTRQAFIVDRNSQTDVLVRVAKDQTQAASVVELLGLHLHRNRPILIKAEEGVPRIGFVCRANIKRLVAGILADDVPFAGQLPVAVDHLRRVAGL